MPGTFQNLITSDQMFSSITTSEDGRYQALIMYLMNENAKICIIERGVQEFGVDHDEHVFTGAEATELGLPQTENDSHDMFGLGFDKRMYIRLAGHMHNYNTNPWRALRSTNPAPNISSFTVDTVPTSMDARVSYPMFIPTPTDLLLYTRDSPAPLGGTARGNAGLWKFNRTDFGTSARIPFAQGVSIPPDGSDTTVDDETNFAPYILRPYIEALWERNPGRLHTVIVHRQFDTGGSGSPPEVDKTNIDMGYLWADPPYDENSFFAMNGTPVEFPIIPGPNGNNPDILTGLTANSPGDPGYLNGGDIVLDNDGYPCFTLSNNPPYLIRWNGTAWTQQILTQSVGGHAYNGRFSLVNYRGTLWRISTRTKSSQGGLVRHPCMISIDGTKRFQIGGRVSNSFPSPTDNWELNYDKEAYRLFGTVEVLTPQGDIPYVHRVGTR